MADQSGIDQKYEQVYRSRKKMMLDNFLGGISWSVGTFVGFALLAVLAGFIISRINLVPIIGGWLSDIVNNAAQDVSLPQAPQQ